MNRLAKVCHTEPIEECLNPENSAVQSTARKLVRIIPIGRTLSKRKGIHLTEKHTEKSLSNISNVSSQNECLKTESSTSKKRMESVNKIKPCKPPLITKKLGATMQSPADLLRHLNGKLIVSTPIHQLSGLMRESNVGKRPSSKIRITSNDPLASRYARPQ